MNIYQLLELLKVRRAMYLGNDCTFGSLHNFISGFVMAASDEQLQQNDSPSFKYFNTWLLGNLERHFGLSGGWHWQITNRQPKNDEKAFEDFFMFIDIFKQSKIHSKFITLDKAALEFNNSFNVKRGKGEVVLNEKKPLKIVWTTIENSTTVWLDYIDLIGNPIGEGNWIINESEAFEKITDEFGVLKNNWQII
jgi:hypothetical protein